MLSIIEGKDMTARNRIRSLISKACSTAVLVALMSGQATRTLSTPCYDGTMTIEPGHKPKASYRRPGGHLMKERWWYNAVLEGLAKVTDKSGKTKAIALVN